jgi:hypothetical protein
MRRAARPTTMLIRTCLVGMWLGDGNLDSTHRSPLTYAFLLKFAGRSRNAVPAAALCRLPARPRGG